MAFAARKSAPTREIRPPTLRVDPAKYPNLTINPSLERALRIRQELEKGRPREEAVALADAAMGNSKKPASRRPAAGRRSPKVAGRAKVHAPKRSR